MDDDPLWYDRAEPDEPPGYALQVIATMVVVVPWLSRLPGRLWRIAAHRIGPMSRADQRRGGRADR